MRSLFLSLLFLPTLLFSQVYNVTKYSREDGLVQSQVIALLEDRQGYLWLGTHRGVDKFDGIYFQNILEELSGSFVSDVLEDKAGNIWIATENGLDYFDGLKIVSFSEKGGMYEGGFSALGEDGEGNIWLGTNGAGVWVFQDDSLIQNPFGANEKLNNASVRALLGDSEGNMWIASLEGLFVKEKGKAIKAVDYPALQGIEALSLYEDQQGLIWVGTQDGMFKLDQEPQHYSLHGKGFDDTRVFCMVEDDEGTLWFGTGNGMGKLEATSPETFQADNELLNIRLTSALKDKEGNLWFGTDGGGIRRITEGVFQTYAGGKVLSSNLAKSFLEDQQGNIWVSTKDQGINILNKGKLIRTLTEEDGLGGEDICSSFEDHAGNFWFASYSGTLTRYSNGQYRVFNEQDGLICNAVYWVTQDKDKLLWIGTDQGVFTYKDGKIHDTFTADNGLPSSTVYTILPASDGRLWIGTKQGLGFRDQFGFHVFEGDTTIGNNVITLIEDPKKRIWVGSAEGLACIIDNKPYWIKISGTPGAHTVVSLIMEDEDFLWVGTENGAYRLQLDTFDPINKNKFEHYIEKDGLLSKECNANAIFKDKNGGIWIGTSDGASYRPTKTSRQELLLPPALYITQILDQTPIEWANDYELDSMNLPIDLKLPYTQTRVDFQFIGISLKSPEQVEYRFKLEGVDDDWQRPTHATSVFYPNLRPGTYTFKITAKRETELWNYDYYKSFEFTITPPIWLTAWFQILILASLAVITYYFYHNYMSRRRQAVEEQRIRNTAEKLQLEHQALYAMMNPHFTFNALQSIQNYIQRNDKKTAHKFLSSFAKLVRKNLDSTKVDYISLGEEIDRLKLYMNLEKMRFPEKFDYDVHIDPELDLSETKLPPMVLQPFVENSIKHGIMSLEQGGLIEIFISQKDEDYLNILIRDNGIGIAASKQRRRNRPSDHVSKGMQITKDRLALFARMTEKEYELDIREEKDAGGEVMGTLVEMTLPMHVGPLEFAI